MSGKTKVIVNISKCNDADAIIKTDIVLDHLTENTVEFPNPTVSLSTMRTNKVDLEKKIVNAQYGGVEDTLKKNKARDIVNNNYRSNGNYVNSVINGSKAKALLSGYELAKQRSKSVKDVFELVNTKIPGQIIVYCRQSPKIFYRKVASMFLHPRDRIVILGFPADIPEK